MMERMRTEDCLKERAQQTNTYFWIVSHMQIWLHTKHKAGLLNNQTSSDFRPCKNDPKGNYANTAHQQSPALLSGRWGFLVDSMHALPGRLRGIEP